MSNKKEKLFNIAISKFKSIFSRILVKKDLELIKARKSKILASFEIDEEVYTKKPQEYENIIINDFKIVLFERLRDDYLELSKKFYIKNPFESYLENFWNNKEMKEFIPFKNHGWGGAGLIISNDKNWTGYPDRDISIYTEDYRFCILITEVYALYKKNTPYINRYGFCDVFGRVLQKNSKKDEPLPFTKEIFSELSEALNIFFQSQKDNILNSGKKIQYYMELCQ